MNRKLASAAALLLLAACARGELNVRQVGSIHDDKSDGTTNGRVALALGQLHLGNVALALEGFRRAAREDPASAEALAGMAECYQRMERPALARRYLEQALALRPQEAGLYRALAVVSDSEGKTEEAASLRREAALRAAGMTAAKQRVTLDLPAPMPVASMPSQSVTITLPPPSAPEPVKAVAEDEGPRLVRMSMGEVMLVSRGAVPFESVRLASDTIHAPLRVLNAARIEGIAARTRLMLAAKGVKGIEIGNAPGRRMVSQIQFASIDRARAEAIAARLPYPVQMIERSGPLVMLVGRDAGKGA